MSAARKLKKPVYVTTILEKSQHEALKHISYKQSKPMSELIREALAKYINQEPAVEGKTGLSGLRGLGKGLWKEDAQVYVDKLRKEWHD